MLTLEFSFLNASFSLACAYLKIKIFIVHFKPELHRFLFDTVQRRASSLQEMQCISVYSAIKDLKTCPPQPSIITGQRGECSLGSYSPRPPSKAAWRAGGPSDSPSAPTGAEPQTGSPSLTGAAHHSGTLSNPAEQKTHAETDNCEKTVSATGLDKVSDLSSSGRFKIKWDLDLGPCLLHHFHKRLQGALRKN